MNRTCAAVGLVALAGLTLGLVGCGSGEKPAAGTLGGASEDADVPGPGTDDPGRPREAAGLGRRRGRRSLRGRGDPGLSGGRARRGGGPRLDRPEGPMGRRPRLADDRCGRAGPARGRRGRPRPQADPREPELGGPGMAGQARQAGRPDPDLFRRAGGRPARGRRGRRGPARVPPADRRPDGPSSTRRAGRSATPSTRWPGRTRARSSACSTPRRGDAAGRWSPSATTRPSAPG